MVFCRKRWFVGMRRRIIEDGTFSSCGHAISPCEDEDVLVIGLSCNSIFKVSSYKVRGSENQHGCVRRRRQHCKLQVVFQYRGLIMKISGYSIHQIANWHWSHWPLGVSSGNFVTDTIISFSVVYCPMANHVIMMLNLKDAVTQKNSTWTTRTRSLSEW
jgi:hypothetical protein